MEPTTVQVVVTIGNSMINKGTYGGVGWFTATTCSSNSMIFFYCAVVATRTYLVHCLPNRLFRVRCKSFARHCCVQDHSSTAWYSSKFKTLSQGCLLRFSRFVYLAYVVYLNTLIFKYVDKSKWFRTTTTKIKQNIPTQYWWQRVSTIFSMFYWWRSEFQWRLIPS